MQNNVLMQISPRFFKAEFTNYIAKYRAQGKSIHLIGVEFSKESKSVVGFEVD